MFSFFSKDNEDSTEYQPSSVIQAQIVLKLLVSTLVWMLDLLYVYGVEFLLLLGRKVRRCVVVVEYTGRS